MICTEILLIRDKCAIQRHLVVKLLNITLSVLTLIILLEATQEIDFQEIQVLLFSHYSAVGW